ncbi:hypothetical protein ColTof4_01306 [Colletotrichum tofieldiae]|nr:hypothetical protein ColTof3_08553 [Colletotrichum tofieldiae]GKT68883.1 hypothetical protein ColTof4_01306 [Colletotrichum tofieldiae]
MAPGSRYRYGPTTRASLDFDDIGLVAKRYHFLLNPTQSTVIFDISNRSNIEAGTWVFKTITMRAPQASCAIHYQYWVSEALRSRIVYRPSYKETAIQAWHFRSRLFALSFGHQEGE